MRCTYMLPIAVALGLVALGLVGAQTAKDGAAQSPAPPTQPGAKDDAAGRAISLAELGVTEGAPVDSGFVFLDGRYIESPYRVSRRGVGLYINDAHLYDRGKWPPFKFDEVLDDPGAPPGLTKDSTFDDMRIPGKPDGWDSRKYRWLLAHKTPEEARRLIIQYYQALPFVKGVQGGGADQLLVVETLTGKKIHMDLTHTDLTPPSKEQVLKGIDGTRAYLEKGLAGGGCFFFFTKGLEVSCGKAKAARDLGLIAEIMRSGRANEDKATLLRRMGLLPGGEFASLEQFLANFQASDQLDRRVEALVKQTGVKPRRVEDLPPLPPDPTPLGSRPAPGGAPPKGAP